MARLRKKMPPFQGVAAGLKATCNLPVGLTYDIITLNYKESGVDANEATMKAGIDRIRLLLDAEAKIDLSATELLDIYKYYGYTIQAGRIPLIFARPTARTAAGEDSIAYGTKDISTMSLEVDINSGATAPTITAHAVQSAPRNLGAHVSMKSYGSSSPGAGVVEMATLPRGNYWQMGLHIASSAVTDVELLSNQNIVWEGNVLDNTQIDHLTGKVWQSGYFHVNNTENDRVRAALPLNVEDYRLKMTMSGAVANFNVIQERLEIKAANRR